MPEVLAKALGVREPTLAAIVGGPDGHLVQVLVNSVMGTKPFKLRGVARKHLAVDAE